MYAKFDPVPGGYLNLTWPETTGVTQQRGYFDSSGQLVFTEVPGQLRHCYYWGRKGVYLEGNLSQNYTAGSDTYIHSGATYRPLVGFYGPGTLTWSDAGGAVNTVTGAAGKFSWASAGAAKTTSVVTTYSGLSSLQHVLIRNSNVLGPFHPWLGAVNSTTETVTFTMPTGLEEVAIHWTAKARVYTEISGVISKFLTIKLNSGEITLGLGAGKNQTSLRFIPTSGTTLSSLSQASITRTLTANTESLPGTDFNFALSLSKAGALSFHSNGNARNLSGTIPFTTVNSVILHGGSHGMWHYDFKVYPTTTVYPTLQQLTRQVIV